ncbi:MAG: M48 family metalloprotease [Terracidiphilus sp.]|jgi:predicted Zn-dependent protease
MPRPLAIALCVLLLCGVSVPQSSAQASPLSGVLTGKQKKGQEGPIDLSNVDKDKIARIEQMPEVQDAIQQEWDALRRNDMQLAYGINLTENMGLSQDSLTGDSFDRQRLYSNPVVQSYINHIGQRLVPKSSTNVYTFRVLYDPIPKALTLSTGTIYLSTGLLSMLSNEAELAYVEAHEIAHVELRQAYLRIRDKNVEVELAKEKAEKEKMITDVGSLVMGAGLGGAMIPLRLGSLMGGSAGLATGMEVGHYFIHPQIEPVEWATREEDDSDDMAINLMIEQGYDPRDVNHLFASLNQVVTADSRMGLGFMGSAPRIKERQAHLDSLFNGNLKAEIEMRSKGKGFNPSSPDFGPMISSVKRDNGILSMDYDLFAVAKRNLQGAVEERPDDPYAQFYLAKLERLTARTPEERQDALNHLTAALRLDAERGAIPSAHLEYAVALMEAEDPSNRDQISSELKAYVALSERDHTGLPSNMPLIYDYLTSSGDSKWYLPPQWYAAQLTNNPGFTTTAPDAVIRKATMLEGPPQAAPAAPAAAPSSRGKVKTTAQNKPAAKPSAPAAN